MQSDEQAGQTGEQAELTEEQAALTEAGRKLFAGPCDFILSAVQLSGLPGGETPEVAFAGRSNVGKSSLVNALTGRKTLARTSNTPGRTRELNVFDLGGTITLIDMPGYGYARASKKLIAGWTGLVRDYLRGRVRLRRVFLLIDARHGIKSNDAEVIELMDKSAVSYQAVLTKIDKIKAADREKVLNATRKTLAKHPAAHPVILTTSSRKGEGLAELRAEIASLAIERH